MASMGVVRYLSDRLTNAITGQGTRFDARTASAYAIAAPLTQQEIASAYSGSGILRKVIQIPALDMVREWRDITGLDDTQAALLFDEEKRLGIRQKVQQAETLRGLGGGALILGLPGVPHEEARPGATGSLAFVHVVSRWHLSFDDIDEDYSSPGFGEPAMWKMNTAEGQMEIHPSRVIPFRADTSAALTLSAASGADLFWGEGRLAQVLDAAKDFDTARSSFASLIRKARLTRIGIPDLISLASSPDGEAQVMTRLGLIATAESIHNASIYDAGSAEDGKGGEKIEDVDYTFAGMKDVLNAYGEQLAAVADIPATRLLGRAPEGMNASGDSQQADWRKKVRAMQTLDMAPCLDRLDRFLVPSAIGSMPPEYAYDFAPLDTETGAERATRFKIEAEAAKIVRDMDVVPDEAFAKGAQSWLVAEGYLPELESALGELGDDERYGISPEGVEEGGDPFSAGEGGVAVEQPAIPPRRAANDAAPRPLYVYRKLLNGADLVKWAKGQGFETTLPAADMHVTVLYSKQPVDPMAMGETWSSEQDGGLTIKAGGPRALEKFEGGAVVLQFASWSLESRHREMVERGGSHDWPEYQPHVTLSYAAPEGLDLTAVVPFAGELWFGPEVFEPIDEDWKAKIEEA